VQTIDGNILVIGNDSRGTLYGAGALLRHLHMDHDTLEGPDDLRLASAPKYALRGHQLGYRPKTNSYDAWDLPQWDRYIRELAVFGTNAIELIPPRSDDDANSPHFPMPPLEMMAGMSGLGAELSSNAAGSDTCPGAITNSRSSRPAPKRTPRASLPTTSTTGVPATALTVRI